MKCKECQLSSVAESLLGKWGDFWQINFVLKYRHRFLAFIFFAGISALPTFADTSLNAVFNMALWKDDNLWDDRAVEVAQRLRLPGSQSESSNYFGIFPKGTQLLSAEAFSFQLYAENGKPSQVILGFVTKSDWVRTVSDDQKITSAEALMQVEKDWPARSKKDFESVTSALSKLVGYPSTHSDNQITWAHWPDRFTLTLTDNALALKIEPYNKQNYATYSTDYTSRVDRLLNGDVVLKGIPAIDQGPRGFCAPAAWEKCLRYHNLNMDIYQIADIGGTSVSGTQMMELAAKMNIQLEKQNFKVQLLKDIVPTADCVRSYIDHGYPLIWSLNAVHLDDWISESATRTDSGLEKNRTTPASSTIYPHAITIVGYNSRLKEICLSDTRSSAASFQRIWVKQADLANFGLGEQIVVILPNSASMSSVSTSSGVTVQQMKHRWY
jgi:hypothetical protein